MLITHLNWQSRINKKEVFSFFEAQRHYNYLGLFPCSAISLRYASGMPLRPGLNTPENALNVKRKNKFIKNLRFQGFNKLLKGPKLIIFHLHPRDKRFHAFNHFYSCVFTYITRETKTLKIF